MDVVIKSETLFKTGSDSVFADKWLLMGFESS